MAAGLEAWWGAPLQMHDAVLVILMLAALALGATQFLLRIRARRTAEASTERSLAAARDAHRTDFRLAMESLTQAVWRFDADGRLVLGNGRGSESLGLPIGALQPGTTLAELAAISAAAYAHGTAGLLRRLGELAPTGSPSSFVHHLPDGRTLSVLFRPLTDGGWLVTIEDVTERQAADERMRYLARHDSLTGLSNRLDLQEQLAAAIAAPPGPARSGIALIFLDLDNFKGVNEALGHPVGDGLLRATAARILGGVRSARAGGDVVARLGDDEFAVLMRSPAARLDRLREDAQTVAARLATVLVEPFLVDGHEIVCGAAMGVAVHPADGRTADELLRTADLALFAAKAGGRGRLRFFEPAMDEGARSRHAMEADLRAALADGEGRDFVVHFQPTFSAAMRRPTGCEALLRWRRRGQDALVGPAAFVPLAEETGLIVPLGALVLREACRVAAGWSDRTLHVAVNMSPAQFRGEGMVEMVVQELARSGLEPNRLLIEVTEGLLLERTEETLRTMQRLHAIGVRFAMDDFGTGYSSLAYLRSFPFARLKIDAAFVREIEARPQDAAIVRSVVAMCAELGITTVAEGVETEGQFRILAEARCDEVQGFLLGRPVPAAALWQAAAASGGGG